MPKLPKMRRLPEMRDFQLCVAACAHPLPNESRFGALAQALQHTLPAEPDNTPPPCVHRNPAAPMRTAPRAAAVPACAVTTRRASRSSTSRSTSSRWAAQADHWSDPVPGPNVWRAPHDIAPTLPLRALAPVGTVFRSRARSASRRAATPARRRCSSASCSRPRRRRSARRCSTRASRRGTAPTSTASSARPSATGATTWRRWPRRCARRSAPRWPRRVRLQHQERWSRRLPTRGSRARPYSA